MVRRKETAEDVKHARRIMSSGMVRDALRKTTRAMAHKREAPSKATLLRHVAEMRSEAAKLLRGVPGHQKKRLREGR